MLEARGFPPHLAGVLGPRMHHLILNRLYLITAPRYFISLKLPLKFHAGTYHMYHMLSKGRCQKKKRFYLGLCPKLWVGGGQES